MAAIRGRDTTPELRVRRTLHALVGDFNTVAPGYGFSLAGNVIDDNGDGKFDVALYRNVLTQNNYTPGSFERLMREDLSLQLRYSLFSQKITLPSFLDDCNNINPDFVNTFPTPNAITAATAQGKPWVGYNGTGIGCFAGMLCFSCREQQDWGLAGARPSDRARPDIRCTGKSGIFLLGI